MFDAFYIEHIHKTPSTLVLHTTSVGWQAQQWGMDNSTWNECRVMRGDADEYALYRFDGKVPLNAEAQDKECTGTVHRVRRVLRQASRHEFMVALLHARITTTR